MALFKKNHRETYYKFKSIKTYAWDQAMGDVRKYRKVFDQSEINYLNVTIELYNKLFDEQDWEAKFTFKAFTIVDGEKTTEHCSFDKEETISKNDNLYRCDFGWGNDDYGTYWKKGMYLWEVYIEDDLLASVNFYIEDAGLVNHSSNPFFNVVSLKTYEAPYGDRVEEERDYLKQFNGKETRYIMSELKISSHLPETWMCELLYKYYDDTGILIGIAENLETIESYEGEEAVFTLTSGIGTKDGGSWNPDNYRIEVVFMDSVVAIIPFVVGDLFVKRLSEYDALLNEEVGDLYGKPSIPNIIHTAAKDYAETSDTSEAEKDTKVDAEEAFVLTEEITPSESRTVNEVMLELNELIGLEEVKDKVKEYIDYVNYLRYRKDKGLEGDEEILLHSVLTGNPGTGKTTVVHLLGEIYYAMGLLSKGHVHSVESSDLISGYIRQTGKTTKEAIEKARGGVLLIDEAYMLYKQGDKNDFGPEAITALITEMSDGVGDIAIIVAGYPKEMNVFINSNPGLKSRFKNYYHFDDFTPDQMMQIADFAARKKDVVISDNAKIALDKVVTEAFRKRDQTFGNARFVHSLIDEAKMNLGIRLVRSHDEKELTKELLATIEAIDVEATVQDSYHAKLKLKVDEELLADALEELNRLIGLVSIKKDVNELIRLTRYYRDINKDILNSFSLHTVFMGNPGTGKTTVARILGQVYKALGLLERGHLIDADGSDLIAGFVGQSALKTKELVNRSLGGVLFIDEAYSISEGGAKTAGTDFGQKAIAALIKEMEDHRGQFAVIAAGYPDNMKSFIEANPGIKSRFDRTFKFNDFTENELWEIAVMMFGRRDVKPDAKASEYLKNYISDLYKQRNKYFGNARSIRKMVEKAFRNHELAMADLSPKQRTKKRISTITLAEVQEFETKQGGKASGIGFRANR